MEQYRTLAAGLQPDQQPSLWDDHVTVYEGVFEPLTTAFAERALSLLRLEPGSHLLDIGAGAGGAALLAASLGHDVTAIDASCGMVERIRSRARSATPGRVQAAVMDGTALALPDAHFDAVLSVFGVVLFSDVAAGLREIARVLRPDGRAAIVTWTDIHRYELAQRLASAIAVVQQANGRDSAPAVPADLPVQLRFREEAVFRAALAVAGLQVQAVVPIEEHWSVSSARWIADRLAFAPGLASQLAALGADRDAVVAAFAEQLIRDQGEGEVVLTAVAHVGLLHGKQSKTCNKKAFGHERRF